MSLDASTFFDQCLPLPGVVACTMQLPDRSVVTRCDGQALTPERVENTLKLAIQAAEALNQSHPEAYAYCWTFDHAHVRLACHPGGAFLVVLSEYQRDQPDTDGAQQLIHTFLRLPEI